MTNTVATIKQQLDTLGLKARGLRFVAWDANTLKVSRGTKGVMIAYNQGTDLYDVTSYQDFDIQAPVEGVYADSLLQVIRPALGA